MQSLTPEFPPQVATLDSGVCTIGMRRRPEQTFRGDPMRGKQTGSQGVRLKRIAPVSPRVLNFRSAAVLCALTSAWPMGAGAADSPEGPTGKVSQPIIVGQSVSRARQKELGLVTVAGGCSGTLLNQYWVLTNDHCVTTDGTPGGPDRPLAQITLTARWRNGTVTPIRSVRYWNSNNLDVALLFLGRRNFGSRDRNARQIYHNVVDTSMTLTKFGQGLCSFATGSGPSARPAQADCGYRMAEFTPGSATETSIVLRPNDAGQIASGGDSGGPDYVTDADGNTLSIASVQSTCQRSGSVAGMPVNWQWTTSISFCTSAALYTIRDDIMRVIKEEGPPDLGILPNRPGAGELQTKPEIVPNRPGAAALQTAPDLDKIVSNRSSIIPHDNFSGAWATVTASGRQYAMNLAQTGDAVSGSYASQDGRITGTISGRIVPRTVVLNGVRLRLGVLVYRWTEGSSAGSGTFTLAADGNSFEGWWNSVNDPDAVQASWNGTRK